MSKKMPPPLKIAQEVMTEFSTTVLAIHELPNKEDMGSQRSLVCRNAKQIARELGLSMEEIVGTVLSVRNLFDHWLLAYPV